MFKLKQTQFVLNVKPHRLELSMIVMSIISPWSQTIGQYSWTPGLGLI